MVTQVRFNALISMTLLSALLMCWKFIPVQGLNGFTISWSHAVLPLMGALFGAVGSYLLVIRSCLFLVTMAVGLKTQLFFGLPTLFSSLYWSTESVLLRVGVPLLCMILFVVHPVGFYAAPYTLFWLIPISAHFKRDNSLVTSMASTFTAHAVGSVMHLYMIGTLSSSAWLALMPIVILERLALGFGMYVAYKVIINVKSLLEKRLPYYALLCD